MARWKEKIPPILVTDHSRFSRSVIIDELKEAGFKVLEAATAEEAQSICTSQPISLVTLAVELPDLNGFELCANIKNQTGLSELPVIFVTGNDTIDDRLAGFKSGAVEFIAKPFKKGLLAKTVEELLHNETDDFSDVFLRDTTVLVVDDSPLARQYITDFLTRKKVSIIEASDVASGFSVYLEHRDEINLILADFILPDGTGDQLAQKIRQDSPNENLPIIALSSLKESLPILQLFRHGITDYVAKPFIKEELLARILSHLKVNRLTEELERSANTDFLTQVNNRRAFFREAGRAVSQRNRYGHCVSLILFDLDHFKQVNDQLGHEAGDAVLAAFAVLLTKNTREADLIGRIGGEEFAILAVETPLEGTLHLATKILEITSQTDLLVGLDTKRTITASAGIYFSPPGDKADFQDIYRAADEELYKAKESGRNRVFHTSGATEE